MRIKDNKLFVLLSLLFSVISSVSVLLCIVKVQSDEAEQKLIFTASILFWLGLVFEQLFIWMANAQRKKLSGKKMSAKSGNLPGVFSFFKTKLGKVSDIVLIVSVVVFIIMVIAEISVDFAQFIILFLIVLSFRFHCIANGKNYMFKSEIKKRGSNS